MTLLTNQYDAVCRGAVVNQLINQPVFQIDGPHASRYLQGRLTQNIAALKEGAGAESLMLTPQGKIQAKLFILNCNDSFLLFPEIVSQDQIAPFTEALLQFKVADQLELRLLDDLAICTVQGRSSRSVVTTLFPGLALEHIFNHSLTAFNGQNVRIINHPRCAFSGYDILCNKKDCIELVNAVLSSTTETPLSNGSAELLELLRIKSVFPLYGKDLSIKNSAADINLDTLVSFTKGCYSGQEVVEKSIALGKPNKRLVLLQSLAGPFDSGTELTNDDGEKVGAITSSTPAPSLEGSLSLGFIKAIISQEQSLAVGAALAKQVTKEEICNDND